MKPIKCPYCSREGGEYSLDFHLKLQHGVRIDSPTLSCAWCHETIISHLGQDLAWRRHLYECTAFQAWLLSGVLVNE